MKCRSRKLLPQLRQLTYSVVEWSSEQQVDLKRLALNKLGFLKLKETALPIYLYFLKKVRKNIKKNEIPFIWYHKLIIFLAYKYMDKILKELKELHERAEEINREIDIPNMDEKQESYLFHFAVIFGVAFLYVFMGLLR